jgi:hypothetical protein
MILPFAIASWVLSLALVTGLCLAARRGDIQEHGEPLAEPVGDAIERFVIVREVATHSSGPAAPPDPVGQPAVRTAEDGRVSPEDELPHHAQAPGDLALQPG